MKVRVDCDCMTGGKPFVDFQVTVGELGVALTLDPKDAAQIADELRVAADECWKERKRQKKGGAK